MTSRSEKIFVTGHRGVVDCRARITFDGSEPDGTPRKLLDVSRLTVLGWQARTPLREGIARAYAAAPFNA